MTEVQNGVKENEAGMWEVFVNGEQIARVHTNREAWRTYDDHLNAIQSRAEDVNEWQFRHSASGWK